MHVFIAWSGPRSRAVGEALKEWLRVVLPSIETWFSPLDIASGSFWSADIQTSLRQAFFGIACVTSENVSSPWMAFEAGAISNRLNGAFCPYLFGLTTKELASSPMSQLQAREGTHDGTTSLVLNIAKAARAVELTPPPDDTAKFYVEKFWDMLDAKFRVIPAPERKLDDARSPTWYLENILQVVQRLDQQASHGAYLKRSGRDPNVEHFLDAMARLLPEQRQRLSRLIWSMYPPPRNDPSAWRATYPKAPPFPEEDSSQARLPYGDKNDDETPS